MLITGSKQAGEKRTARVTFCNFIFFFDAEVSTSFLCQARDELYALMEFRGALL